MSLPKYNRRDFFNKTTVNDRLELDLLSFKWIDFSRYYNRSRVRVHKVMQHEEGRLWLISEKYYNTYTMYWLIALVNGILNPAKDVVAGLDLTIPSIVDIDSYYQSIRSASRKQLSVQITKPVI